MYNILIVLFIIFIIFLFQIWSKIKEDNDFKLSKNLNKVFIIIIIFKFIILFYFYIQNKDLCSISKILYC
jgi:hypothetical protein